MTGAVTDPEARELIDRAMKLAPDVRESIALELLDSVEDDTDYWAAIARRSEDIASGKVVALTRDEAEQQIREKLRTLGAEL
jgi:hypothetical protein